MARLRLWNALLVVLLAELVAPRSLVGQVAASPALPVGARARIEWMETARYRRVVGTVVDTGPDSLALDGPEGARTFRFAQLRRIDIRVPRTRLRGAARGAGIGVLTGIAIGLALGGYGATQCGEGDDMCGIGLIVLPPLGGAAGLTLGAIAGAGWPGTRWKRVR